MSTRRYLKAIWKNLGYLANWIPTRDLKVGHIGTWDRDTGFSKIDSLASKDIRFRTEHGDGLGTLRCGATHSKKAGAAVDSAFGEDTGLTFDLGAQGDFLFYAEGCASATIAGADLVLQQLKSHLRNGLWEEDYIIITEVVTAARATIVMSETPQASFSLTGLKDPNDLVSADLSLSVRAGQVTQFLSEVGLTPLFKGWQVDRNWYGGVRARAVTFSPGEPDTVDGKPRFVSVEP